MENINVNEEIRQAKRKSAKPMLWIAMISIVMFFAGLTSAYVISRERNDWVTFDLPNAFYGSTALIILSSITLILSEKLLKRNELTKSRISLLITFILGIAFIYYQYHAFNELRAQGLYFTGKGSTVSTSFIVGITLMHIFHLIGGTISLSVVIYNHFKEKYNSTETLGFELGATYWHFVDILWVYLFLFFYFIR